MLMEACYCAYIRLITNGHSDKKTDLYLIFMIYTTSSTWSLKAWRVI